MFEGDGTNQGFQSITTLTGGVALQPPPPPSSASHFGDSCESLVVSDRFM